MTLDDWFAFSTTDADRRSLPDMRPVLKGLQGAAASLRAAEWNDDARGQTAAMPATASTPGATPTQPSQPSQPAQSSQPSQTSQQPQPSPRASS